MRKDIIRVSTMDFKGACCKLLRMLASGVSWKSMFECLQFHQSQLNELYDLWKQGETAQNDNKSCCLHLYRETTKDHSSAGVVSDKKPVFKKYVSTTVGLSHVTGHVTELSCAF